jgi:hypothetical protein
MAARGEGASPPRVVSAAVTAQLVALFRDEQEHFSDEFMEALQRLLAEGGADLDVCIDGMTPLLLVRSACGAART